MAKVVPSYGIIIVGHFCKKSPKAEKYSLALADKEEKILDYIHFEVKGPEADRNLLSEDREGTFAN